MITRERGSRGGKRGRIKRGRIIRNTQREKQRQREKGRKRQREKDRKRQRKRKRNKIKKKSTERE